MPAEEEEQDEDEDEEEEEDEEDDEDKDTDARQPAGSTVEETPGDDGEDDGDGEKEDENDGQSTGRNVGVAAGVIGLAVIACVGAYCLRKKCSSDPKPYNTPDGPGTQDLVRSCLASRMWGLSDLTTRWRVLARMFSVIQ